LLQDAIKKYGPRVVIAYGKVEGDWKFLKPIAGNIHWKTDGVFRTGESEFTTASGRTTFVLTPHLGGRVTEMNGQWKHLHEKVKRLLR
jgi:hypothetical protein